MKQPGGATYSKLPDPLTPDPEAVRVDPVWGNVLWTSEGDRTLASATGAFRVARDHPRRRGQSRGHDPGPRLSDGHGSLVVVADDNFPTADSATYRNQFLVFDIQP